MIARTLSKTQPIPFQSSSDNEASAAPRSAVPLANPAWATASRPAPHAPTHHHAAAKPSSTPRRQTHAAGTHEPVRSTTGHSAPLASARRPGELSAKYLGQGSLSVRSSVTGRHYRFEGHGATQTIDTRDQMMLRRINELLIA
jgi:hypothetical protein